MGLISCLPENWVGIQEWKAQALLAHHLQCRRAPWRLSVAISTAGRRGPGEAAVGAGSPFPGPEAALSAPLVFACVEWGVRAGGEIPSRGGRDSPLRLACAGKLRHAVSRAPKPGVERGAPPPKAEEGPRAVTRRGRRAGGRQAAAAAGAAAEGGREEGGGGRRGRGGRGLGTSPFITRPLPGSRAASSSAVSVWPPRPAAPGPGPAREPPGRGSGGRPPTPPAPGAQRSPAEAAPSEEEEEQGTAAGPGSGARAAAASAAAAAAARADAAGRTTSSPSPGAPAPRAPDRGHRRRRRRRRRGQRRWRRRLCSFGSSWPPGNYKSQGAWRRAAGGRGGVGASRPEVAVEAEVARPRWGLEHGGGTRSGSGGGSSGGGGGGWRRRRRRTGVSHGKAVRLGGVPFL